MTWKRSFGHKDKNHSAIVADLQKCGVYVVELQGNGNGVADLLLHWGGNTVLAELKNEKGRNTFSRGQITLMANYPGLIGFASDYIEAYRLATLPHDFALNVIEKYHLKQFLVRDDFKQLGMSRFLKVIGRGENGE